MKGDSHTQRLSLDTHKQKNRGIFSSNLFPSYLPKREVSSLQATLGTSDYLFLRGEHCLLWAWVAEGLGDIPVFFHHHPPSHRWLLTPGLWVWPKRWPSEMAKGYWWPAQQICNCAGPRLRGVISVSLWAAEPPKGKTAEPRTPCEGLLTWTSLSVISRDGDIQN